jgi:replicative DNA helicase
MTPTQIPHSPAAEAAVIGSLLIHPESFKDLKLSADDFYIEAHRLTFRAIQALRAANLAVDYTTVCTRLSAAGQLEIVGGPSMIMATISGTISSVNIASYAEIVRTQAKRRFIVMQANALANAAYDQDTDINEAVSSALDKLSKFDSDGIHAVHISEYLSQAYDEADKAAANPREVYGVPTGFADWDKISKGIQLGTVVKLIGPPGLGKSLLLGQVLANAAAKGHACALYQLEMTGIAVVRRIISGESKIPTYKMRSGTMNDDDWEAYSATIEKLSTLPVYVCANPYITTDDIRADVRRLKREVNLELVGVDYESLLNDRERGADQNEIGYLKSKRLHAIASKENIGIISLDSLNKAGQAGAAPGATGMSGSAGKAHEADEIMNMSTDNNNTQIVTVTWEKNREGAAKRIFILKRCPEFPFFEQDKRP